MSLEIRNTEKVEACLLKASQKFERAFVYQDIRYDIRGKVAGQLIREKSRIGNAKFRFRFNKSLLEKYGEEFIDQVAPHECAHLVAYAVYGNNIRPHGKEWQWIMREVFELEPEVTHRFEVESARRLNAYHYACACPELTHKLTSIRHNKVQSGKARYLCRQCREVLVEQVDYIEGVS